MLTVTVVWLLYLEYVISEYKTGNVTSTFSILFHQSKNQHISQNDENIRE